MLLSQVFTLILLLTFVAPVLSKMEYFFHDCCLDMGVFVFKKNMVMGELFNVCSYASCECFIIVFNFYFTPQTDE